MTTDEKPLHDSSMAAPRDYLAKEVNVTDQASVPTAQHVGDAESFPITVLELLAEVLDEDVLEMSPLLADVIDPEILVRLRQTDSRSKQTFTFTYRDYTVTATNHGVVSVCQHPPDGSS
ncbi:HalOD1 output domain-containing protein [Saliphagus sp. GCM10025334]